MKPLTIKQDTPSSGRTDRENMTQIHTSSFQACAVSTDKYVSTLKLSVEAKASTIGSSLLHMGISCDCGQTHLTKWLWTPVLQTTWIISNKQLFLTSLSCVNIPLFSFCQFWSMIAFLGRVHCMYVGNFKVLYYPQHLSRYKQYIFTQYIPVYNIFLCTHTCLDNTHDIKGP